jgi:transcriptional regulator with XRE-family HTH domain
MTINEYADYFDYDALVRFKELYDTTETSTIKKNIALIMEQYDMKHKHLACVLGVSIHTAYSYTEIGKHNKPEEQALLMMAAKLGIAIQTLFTLIN